MGWRWALLLALQLYHYIIYICTSFEGIRGGTTIIRVPRLKPSRLQRSIDICINDIIPGCSAISSENHIHVNSSKLPMVHAFLRASSIISIRSHSITFWTLISSSLSKNPPFWWPNYTHSLMLPYLPHIFCSRFYFLVTLNCVFCTVHAYSRKVLSFWLPWLASLPPLHRFEIVRRQATNKSFR